MMPPAMKWYEIWNLLACDWCRHGVLPDHCNCVIGSTCSLHCKACGHRSYWPGDLPKTWPWEFECAYCGAKVVYPRRS